MRALAVILILSACSHLHAHKPLALNTIKNILDCSLTLGPLKCLNALTAWRVGRVTSHSDLNVNLKDDLEQFPWIKYRNNTDEELYSKLCDGTERLLRRQALSLTVIPGYRFDLISKENGTLNVDVFKDVGIASARSSMKKAKKTFYKILPFLILPGLIMSAILPFVLPALKLMTVGVGMLNNMALSGAVFTLLRNNAFNDHYEHKVIYVNEGYKNEKHTHYTEQEHANDNLDIQHAETRPSGYEIDEIDTIEELPVNPDWVKQHYGNAQNVHFIENDHHQINHGEKLRLGSWGT